MYLGKSDRQLESDCRMKSSRKQGDQILGTIPKKRAEQFLVELANTRFIAAAEHYDDRAPSSRVMKYLDVLKPQSPAQPTPAELYDLAALVAFYFRKIWDAPDQRHRDWFLFKLREFWWNWYLRVNTGELSKAFHLTPVVQSALRIWTPPEPTAFEAVLFYLQRDVDRLRHCPNPDCVSPYFIATKKGQKYCSDACAVPAQREAKRKWWAENRGKETR